MNEKLTPKKLEEINLERAAGMAKTFMAVGGFPILICGIIPGQEGNQLVSFSFSGADKDAIRSMLMDYLKAIDDASYHVPKGYGS